MGEDGLDGADVVPKEARGYRIPKGNMRVFATMNPAATGGGRSKLPRGITNLFTKVTLKEYHPLELKVILKKICARQLDNSAQDASLDNTLLDGIFRVHEEVQKLVRRRDIGRQGGPYEFNLRDCASPSPAAAFLSPTPSLKPTTCFQRIILLPTLVVAQ